MYRDPPTTSEARAALARLNQRIADYQRREAEKRAVSNVIAFPVRAPANDTAPGPEAA